MGYALLLFNWILFVIEISKAISEAVTSLARYLLSFFYPPPLKDVSGKIVVITGASQGLGRELATCFAKQGSKVIMLDIDEQQNLCTANELRRMGGLQVFAFTCDVSNETQVKGVSEKLLKLFGKVDIIVNNATWSHPPQASSLMQLPSEFIERTLNVNLLSHFWMTRAFLPSMIDNGKSGHIVAISSLSGLVGASKFSSYCASQHGIVGAMSALGAELEEYPDIHVTTACPIVRKCTKLSSSTARFSNIFQVLTIEGTAARLLEAIRRNEDFVIIPKGFALLLLVEQLLPSKLSRYLKEFLLREPHSESDNHEVTVIPLTNGNSCH